MECKAKSLVPEPVEGPAAYGQAFAIRSVISGTLHWMGVSLDFSETANTEAGLFDATVSIHVHTRYSDGGTDLPHIVEAAQESGLDAVIITDHYRARLRKLGAEGWYGNVLVSIGQEQGWHGSHLLALGLESELPAAKDNIRSHVENCLAAGGMAFAAHPHGAGARWLAARAQRWPHGFIPGLHGLEVWCMMHDWIPKMTPWNLLHGLKNPSAYLSGPRAETLRLWDEWSQYGRCVGIGSTDNHARPIFPGANLRAVEHGLAFGCVRTHALLDRRFSGESAKDRELLFNALRGGRVYVARDDLADPRGLICWMDAAGDVWNMGDDLPLRKNLRLHIQSPSVADWTLVRNGGAMNPVRGRRVTWSITDNGVYRLEGRLGDRVWVLANPFRVLTM